MAGNEFSWGQFGAGAFATFLIVLLLGLGLRTDVPDVPTAEEIAAEIELPTMPTAEEIAALVVIPTEEVPEDITTQLAEIKAYQVKEDVFEQKCEDLVNDEIYYSDGDERRSFLKDLTEFLEEAEYTIDDYKDIEYVKVKDIDVENMDVDDGDATVTAKLRVRFYDESENEDIKETVYAEFTVEDNEVDDLEFDL